MNPCVESCSFVMNDPKHVFIELHSLQRVAVEFAHRDDLIIPPWREEVFPESDDKILEFLGVVNSINSCFTDFKTEKKYDVEYPEGSGKIWTGAYGMTAAMKRALDDGIDILSPRVLLLLTGGQVFHIFRCVTTPIPMIKERLDNLRNVGYMLKNFYGSFKNIFEIAEYKLFRADGKGIVNQLVLFESYNDVSRYRGRFITFAKRAQLFPMVYHGRALSSNGRLKPIVDPENFGPIADYQVAKTLRVLGILIYESQLAEMVDRGVVLHRNSDKEIEIRAQTVNAVATLLEKTNALRLTSGKNPITMAEFDYALWSAGRAPEYKNIRHHYTYTTAY